MCLNMEVNRCSWGAVHCHAFHRMSAVSSPVIIVLQTHGCSKIYVFQLPKGFTSTPIRKHTFVLYGCWCAHCTKSSLPTHRRPVHMYELISHVKHCLHYVPFRLMTAATLTHVHTIRRTRRAKPLHKRSRGRTLFAGFARAQLSGYNL